MISSIDPVLAPIADDSTQTMTRLRDQLAAAAKRTSCWTLPIGQWIHLSAHCSSRPPIKDWSRIAYQSEDHDHVLQTLSKLISLRILRAPRRLDQVARQLSEYFTGERRDFMLPLDFQLAHRVPPGHCSRTLC